MGREIWRSVAARARYAALILPPFALVSACSAGPASNETIGTTAQAVMGNVNLGSDCTPVMTAFVERAAWYGRVAASSPAFDQCLLAAFVIPVAIVNPTDGSSSSFGPYQQCNGSQIDPFVNQGLAVQEARGLAMATSPNDFQINCTGGMGNASTTIGPYFNTAPESLSFSTWLTGVDLANNPITSWPVSQGAQILWHEASHDHQYTHGAENQADAIIACGYPPSSSWQFQVNSFPYILQDCIFKTIQDSAVACGALASCPVSTSLRLVTGLNATDCLCVADPNPSAPRPDDSDIDHDGIPNIADSCPTIPNRTQNDTNGLAEFQVAINSGFQAQFPNEGTPPTVNDSLDYFNHYHHWYLGDACDPDPTTAVDTYADTDGVDATCTQVLVDGFGTLGGFIGGSCPRQLTSGLEMNSFVGNGVGTAAAGPGTNGPSFCKCLQAESNSASDLIRCAVPRSSGGPGCIVADDETFPPINGTPPHTLSGWVRITQHTTTGNQPFAPIAATFQPFTDALVASGSYVAQPSRTLWDFPADLVKFGELSTATNLTGAIWAHVLQFTPGSAENAPRANFNNSYDGSLVEIQNGTNIIRVPNYKMAPQPWHWSETNAQTHEDPTWLVPFNGGVYEVTQGHSIDATSRFSTDAAGLLFQVGTTASGVRLLTDEGVARVSPSMLAAAIVTQDPSGITSLAAALQPGFERDFGAVEVNTGGSSSSAVIRPAAATNSPSGIAIGHVVAQTYDAERGRLLSLVSDGHVKAVSSLDVGTSLSNGTASETRVDTTAFEDPIAFAYLGATRQAFILDRVSDRHEDRDDRREDGDRDRDDRDCDHSGGDGKSAHLRLLAFGDDLQVHELWSTSKRADVPTRAFLSPGRYGALLLTLIWNHESELIVLDNIGNVYASTKVRSALENRPVIGVKGITIASSSNPHGASTFLDIETVARPRPEHGDCGAHFLRHHHEGPSCHVNLPTSPADVPNLGE